MTTRHTALGIAALVIGFVLLFFLDGGLTTVVGFALLGTGLAVATLALAFGVRSPDQQQAAAAEAHRDATASAALQRASETGRWPRVIGGG